MLNTIYEEEINPIIEYKLDIYVASTYALIEFQERKYKKILKSWNKFVKNQKKIKKEQYEKRISIYGILYLYGILATSITTFFTTTYLIQNYLL